VRWRIGNPYFCFPCDLAQVSAHHRTGWEGGYIHQTGSRTRKQPGKFFVSFAIHWAVTGDRFDKKEPVPVGVVENHVRHLPVRINSDPKLR
jgi:hypothetical protein